MYYPIIHPKPETISPFRVQLSHNEWILRHPQKETPIYSHPDKDQILRLLPLYFNHFRQKAIVKILDDFGRIMEVRCFNTD